MAVFSRAVFQVAYRVTTGNRVKTVAFPTRLKLREWANVNTILIKFMDFWFPKKLWYCVGGRVKQKLKRFGKATVYTRIPVIAR